MVELGDLGVCADLDAGFAGELGDGGDEVEGVDLGGLGEAWAAHLLPAHDYVAVNVIKVGGEVRLPQEVFGGAVLLG